MKVVVTGGRLGQHAVSDDRARAEIFSRRRVARTGHPGELEWLRPKPRQGRAWLHGGSFIAREESVLNSFVFMED